MEMAGAGQWLASHRATRDRAWRRLLLAIAIPHFRHFSALHPASASLPAPRQKREGNGKRGLESWQGMGCHRIRCSGAHCRPDQAREGFPKSVANNQHHNQGGNLTRPTSSLCEAVRYLYRRGWAMQEIGALFIQWG